MLRVHDPFIDFTLQDQNGMTHSLKDYSGKWLVVYFYPKDNTSACTLEAKDFTSMVEDFADLGAAIVGVSADSIKSHANFTAKQELGVTLLSDPEHVLLEATGVWQKKKMYGKEHMGIVRTSFIVDPNGVVRAVWEKVKAAGHAEEVLKKLKELQAQ